MRRNCDGMCEWSQLLRSFQVRYVHLTKYLDSLNSQTTNNHLYIVFSHWEEELCCFYFSFPSHRNKFFPFKVDPIWMGYQTKVQKLFPCATRILQNVVSRLSGHYHKTELNMKILGFLCHQKSNTNTVLQIRMSKRDDLGIICHITPLKLML